MTEMVRGCQPQLNAQQWSTVPSRYWLVPRVRIVVGACNAVLFARRPHLFVGNLAAELDEETFRETMEGAGEV